MSRKVTILGMFIGLAIVLLIPCYGRANVASTSRVIPIEITSDGRFVPDRVLIKQDEGIIFSVTAHKSNEVTWPLDVLHGFDLMYDNIVLMRKPIKAESKKKVDKATVEVRWMPRFTGEFTLRCPYHHQHKFGTVIVKQ